MQFIENLELQMHGKYLEPNEMMKIFHFITDCFQFENIIHLPSIGIPLVHMLGAIISGSQVCTATPFTNFSMFFFYLFFLHITNVFPGFGIQFFSHFHHKFYFELIISVAIAMVNSSPELNTAINSIVVFDTCWNC